MSEKTVWLDPRRADDQEVRLIDAGEARWDSANNLTELVDAYARGVADGFPISGDLLALVHKHGGQVPSSVEMFLALQRVAAVAKHGPLPRDVRSYWERAGARAIQREVRLALGDFSCLDMPYRKEAR